MTVYMNIRNRGAITSGDEVDRTGGNRDTKILLKQAPPSLDKGGGYKSWWRKLRLWQRLTTLNDIQQVLKLIGMMRDDLGKFLAEQFKQLMEGE